MKLLMYSTSMTTSEISEIKHFATLNNFKITRLSRFFWLYDFKCLPLNAVLDFISENKLSFKLLVTGFILNKNFMTHFVFKNMFVLKSTASSKVTLSSYTDKVVKNTSLTFLNNQSKLEGTISIVKSLVYILAQHTKNKVEAQTLVYKCPRLIS